MINKEQIFLGKDLSTREEVFLFLSETAANRGLADNASSVYQALKNRENEGTTGMMDGFAIPHAKSASIKQPAVFVVKLKAGIDWDSLDSKPTQFIIAMFIPEAQSGTDYLKLLSQIARMLMKEEFKAALMAVTAEEEIALLILEKLEG